MDGKRMLIRMGPTILMVVLALFVWLDKKDVPTQEELQAAYGNLAASVENEVTAYTNYEAYAAKADEEGHPSAAKLFRATAEANKIHAAEQYGIAITMISDTPYPEYTAEEAGTTFDNLNAAIETEKNLALLTYPAYMQQADASGQGKIETAFRKALKADERHAELFQDALINLDKTEDTKYYICPVCGNVAKDKAPLFCPVCSALKNKFVLYEE